MLAAAVTACAFASAAVTAQPTNGRASHAPRRVAQSAPAAPVVVELFTAQGCAACVEANAVVERAAAEPGVVALTYGVDYWDYLGWNDTFARPKFAERQRAYRSALRLRGVSTPEVVIDGRRQVSGARGAELEAAIGEEADRHVWPPQIEFRETGDRVGVGSGRLPVGGAEVLAVTYTPGAQVVQVRAGENRGQAVRHVNVVRDVKRLGDWTGPPVLYAQPADSASEDNVVVLVQSKLDRRILSAARRAEPARD